MFTFDYMTFEDGAVCYYIKAKNGTYKAYTVKEKKLKYICTIPF